MKFNEPPSRIYLQYHGDDTGQSDCPVDAGDITWCWEPIFDRDIVYVRYDWLNRADMIEAAAKNLVAMKGRHNTEIAYKRLVDALNEPIF
jgi:hypothetical protein